MRPPIASGDTSLQCRHGTGAIQREARTGDGGSVRHRPVDRPPAGRRRRSRRGRGRQRGSACRGGGRSGRTVRLGHGPAWRCVHRGRRPGHRRRRRRHARLARRRGERRRCPVVRALARADSGRVEPAHHHQPDRHVPHVSRVVAPSAVEQGEHRQHRLYRGARRAAVGPRVLGFEGGCPGNDPGARRRVRQGRSALQQRESRSDRHAHHGIVRGPRGREPEVR